MQRCCAVQSVLLGAQMMFPLVGCGQICILPLSRLNAEPLCCLPCHPPQDCLLDLAGTLTVGCEATGLAAELAFRPFRGGAVQGAVGVLSGKGAFAGALLIRKL